MKTSPNLHALSQRLWQRTRALLDDVARAGSIAAVITGQRIDRHMHS